MAQPFNANAFRQAMPGWQYPRYFTYLAENSTAAADTGQAIFIRTGRGQYMLNTDPTVRDLLVD